MTTLVLLSFAAPFVAVPAAPASAATTATTLPPAKSWVLVDADTGNVLTSLNDHQALPPGSIAKMLTALIAVDWLPANAEVPVTSDAAAAYPDDVGMKVGQQWGLGITLEALLTDSANDAAYALADDIGGSLQGFGSVMDTASGQVGLVDSPVWHDPAGLDGTEGVDGGDLLSAYDAAILGRDLLSQPLLAQIVAAQSEVITGPDGTVYDLSSKNLTFLQGYSGAIGIKTGFTDAAGSTIVAAATRAGRTMLAVVMNGYNTIQTAEGLLNQGFATPAASEPTTDALPSVRLPFPPAPPAPPTTVPTHGTSHQAAATKHADPTLNRGLGLVALLSLLAAMIGALSMFAERRGARVPALLARFLSGDDRETTAGPPPRRSRIESALRSDVRGTQVSAGASPGSAASRRRPVPWDEPFPWESVPANGSASEAPPSAPSFERSVRTSSRGEAAPRAGEAPVLRISSRAHDRDGDAPRRALRLDPVGPAYEVDLDDWDRPKPADRAGRRTPGGRADEGREDGRRREGARAKGDGGRVNGDAPGLGRGGDAPGSRTAGGGPGLREGGRDRSGGGKAPKSGQPKWVRDLWLPPWKVLQDVDHREEATYVAGPPERGPGGES